MSPDCAVHGAVARPHAGAAPTGVTAIATGPASVTSSPSGARIPSVSGNLKLKRRSPLSTSSRVVKSPGAAVTHVADVTPGGVHAARSTPPQFAASTTTRFEPVSGWNTNVTTWSVAVGRKPLEASHDRSFSSSRSPGAAYGRFVAPSAALKLFSVPGIRLHAAWSGRAPIARTASIIRRAAPRRFAAGIAYLSGQASFFMAAGVLPHPGVRVPRK